MFTEAYKRGGLIMQAVKASGISRRTFYRHEVTISDLREIIRIFREGEYVTPRELAEKIKMSRSSIHRLLAEGKINGFKLFKKVFIDLRSVPDSFEWL